MEIELNYNASNPRVLKIKPYKKKKMIKFS